MNFDRAASKGRQAADDRSVFLWGLFGFLTWLPAVFVAHLIEPRVPLIFLQRSREAEDGVEFERAYCDRMKTKQVRAAWLGLAASILVVMFIYLFILAVALTAGVR